MVKFWNTGRCYISHAKGLTPIQIQYLKGLEAGDKLVVFVEEDGSLNMKKSNLKAQEEDVALHTDGPTEGTPSRGDTAERGRT